MTTTVQKTVGTGGDYSLLQTAEDACPADLRAGTGTDQIWQIRAKKQLFTAAASLLIISGTLVDASHYVELTTDTGASFVDDVNVRTNALRYNSSNGAAIATTGAWSAGVTITQDYTRISKLQFSATSNTTTAISYTCVGGIVDQCIIEGSATNGAYLFYGNSKLRNSLLVQRRASASKIGNINWISAYNCTFVATGGATSGVWGDSTTINLENCYVGGATAATGGTSTFNKTTCFTSVSGPPSGFTGTFAFSTATFQNVTDGTHDFRLASGSGLIGVGTADSANVGLYDISGTAWAAPPAAGAWQTSAGGTDGTAAGATLTGTASLSAGTATGSGTNGTAAGATLTGTASLSAGTASGSSAGTITIPAVKDWGTGNLKLSETGVQVDVRNIATGALVVRKTGQTTHATTGVCVVTDPLLVAATLYEVVTRFADGSIGVWDYTAT